GQGHRQQLAAVTAHRASEAIFSQNIKAPPCTRDGCHSILCRGDAFATLSQHQVQAGQLVPQAVVDPLLCQQLVVGAVLQDALVSQDQDAVVVLDGGQAVGDGQGGAAVGQFFQ